MTQPGGFTLNNSYCNSSLLRRSIPYDMKKTFAFVLCSIFLLAAFMCNTPLEKSAYRTIVASKSFLDSVKAKHPECPASPEDPCPYLQKATGAKDLLIDAVENYCASVDFDSKGGTCTPPTDKNVLAQATAKLSSALANYNQSEADLRNVLK